MPKNHLKRLSSPKTWPILRKERKFVTRPNPGRSFDLAVPLNQVLKLLIGKGNTTKEVKFILQFEEVHVNGVRQHDIRRPVGFMDVVSFPKTKEHFIISISRQGKLIAVALDAKQAATRIVKIRGKTRHAGKFQINCVDGSNLTVDKDAYKTGDSLVINGTDIKKHLPLDKGASIILTGGRHLSSVGTVKEIDGKTIIFETDGVEHSTAKRHAYVVGKTEPEVTLR